jgi:uncharacterized membrane protein
MDKILIVEFNTERQAYEGYRALEELHNEGSITVYDNAVIAVDTDGQAFAREHADRGPLGIVVGTVAADLIGLIDAQGGATLGAAVGVAGRSPLEWAGLGVSHDFLDEVASDLGPGKAALVAEVEEEWVLPVDTLMEEAGGTVFRRKRVEVVDALIARDIAALNAEIDALQAENEQATGEAKPRLQVRIAEAKERVRATQDRANALAEAIRREGEAKAKFLKEQADRAAAGLKNRIDERRARVEADFVEQVWKLHQAP